MHGVPLGCEHLPHLSELLRATQRTPSEYSLANLYLYRLRHSYCLIDGELPHLAGQTYDGASHILPLCPLDEDGAGKLLGGAACIYPLDEDEAQRLSRSGRYCCDYLPEDGDYVYDTAALADLNGARKKRSQAAAFGLLGPSLADFDAESARVVLAGWLEDAGRGPDHADVHECAEAIDCADELGLSGVVVHLADEPVAFLLAGPVRGEDRVVHFAKGRHRFAGAYPWMFARFAGMVGSRLLNFEQDLGNAGLAQAKRALGPLAKVPKYRLRKAASRTRSKTCGMNVLSSIHFWALWRSRTGEWPRSFLTGPSPMRSCTFISSISLASYR
jgi:uncharacterized protein